jgi:hypothetical protein
MLSSLIGYCSLPVSMMMIEQQQQQVVSPHGCFGGDDVLPSKRNYPAPCEVLA